MLLFLFMEEKNIYIIGTVGSEGIKVLIQNKKEELLKYFYERFLDNTIKKIEFEDLYIENILSKNNENEIFETKHLIRIAKGGVLSSLWDLSKIEKVGVEYSQRNIPTYQETIEICNYFDLLPYRLLTKNRFVVFENNDWFEKMRNKFSDLIIVNIGKTHKEKACFRIDSETKSYLTKDYKDEIDKIINKCTKNL